MRVLRARVLEQAQQQQADAIAADRKSQVGSGDRSQRIRTYNFPQGRVTDHRIGLTLHKLESVLNGQLDELINALITADQAERLKRCNNMSEVWTIGKILKWTEEYFQKAQLDSPRLDAEVLLAHVLNRPERIYLYVHFDQPLEQSELAAYRECIKRRVQHEPVAYITGHRDFMGLDFKVTKDTLIPRPDTEILVEAVLQRLPAAGENTTLADIGTGTGAICLSLLNYLPKLRAMAVDISPGALAVAQENSLSLGLSQRVEFSRGICWHL